jgi:hypothetical protein
MDAASVANTPLSAAITAPVPSSAASLLRTQGACNELQRSLLVASKRASRLASEEVKAKQRLETTLVHAQLAARLKLLEVADDAAVVRPHRRLSDSEHKLADVRGAEHRARSRANELKRKEAIAAAAKMERASVRLSVERTRELAYEQSAATVARVKSTEDAARHKRELAEALASSRRKREYELRVDAEVAVQRNLQQQVRCLLRACERVM